MLTNTIDISIYKSRTIGTNIRLHFTFYFAYQLTFIRFARALYSQSLIARNTLMWQLPLSLSLRRILVVGVHRAGNSDAKTPHRHRAQ